MIQLHNVDSVEFIQTLPSESIDVILIDPPYLYLKNQKLERPFDERLFFTECKRVLTKNGFIVMFGRGISFYRWNCILDELGMTFKEEVVWDKNYSSSPVLPLSRTHELSAIFSKGKGKINKVHVPYIESKGNDLGKVIGDVNRLRVVLSNSIQLEAVNDYLETKQQKFDGYVRGEGIAHGASTRQNNPTVGVMKMIESGMVEKSIIKCEHDRYSRIHPTQKPVRLLERLLALVIPDKPRNEIVVADFFGGSMSTMEAVHNMGMQGIACEIDEEYFEAGNRRINLLYAKDI